MSEEKKIPQNDLSTKNKSTQQTKSAKIKSGVITKLSLLASLVAVGLAGYTIIDSESNVRNNQSFSILEKQVEKLKLNQDKQENMLVDMSSKNSSQINNIKALQSQVNMLNSQVAVPTKDLYIQMSVANIQSAIDYLVLAKDIVIFNGDIQRANDLVDTAFDKASASNVATISASDRQDIKTAFKKYISKNTIAKDFINIQQQVGELEYITPQSLYSEKLSKSKNKYTEFLSLIVDIQNIPKDQTLVPTKLAKQFVSDGLYRSLIMLQSAMYTNDKDSISKAKANILVIVKKYFVQNQNAKTLETTIQNIKAQQFDEINNNLNKLIQQLSKQQNELLGSKLSLAKNNFSKIGGEK